ncbi:MAG TPA: PhpK family radical SAM P-methyltransferase [Blastocatellia bacterium]|jgi:p-methyltransferase
MSNSQLDCVVIGYNEIPFERYESFLRKYGEESEAYRDLRLSFVNLDDKKMDYVGLLNHAFELARPGLKATSRKKSFKSGDIPNLAACYLTNFLTKRGLTAKYVNLFQEEKEKLAGYLACNPACVAITTTFYVLNLPVIEMVEFIRARNRDVKIVVGGPLVANHARNYQGEAFRAALDDIGADIYVVEGQGEHTLAQVINRLIAGDGLSDIPNIAYVEEGHLQRTRVVPENNSIDENYIDWRVYGAENLGRTIQTRTARSCAFNCSFCNYPTRAGKLTLANVETVEKELNSIGELGDVRNVVFIDDTFNIPLPRFKDLCRMMIKNDYGFDWYSYFRCSNSDEEAIDLMAKSGCKGVFLGIESGSATILKNMNKAATPEKYIEGMKLLHERGIITFGSFIIGFPGETDETVDETFQFIRETKPTYYRAQMWYCEPGTPIDNQRAKYKIEGEGFVWKHATMDSLAALDHIDRLFLTTKESLWLPQWSFDFWILPYLFGEGITPAQLQSFMESANGLLALDIASVPDNQKKAMQQDYLERMLQAFRDQHQS